MAINERSDRRDRNARNKIVFVINSIGSGGAERVLGNLLRHPGSCRDKYDVHLVLLDKEKDMRVLPEVAQRHCLNAKGSLLKSILRLRTLMAELKPDLIVSFLVRSNVATALIPRGVPRILCERMHLSSHLSGRYKGLRLALLKSLPRRLYHRANLLLAVSDGVRNDLIGNLGVPSLLVQTINNPFDLEDIAAQGMMEPSIILPPRFCVAVGRLVKAKGFEQLISAHSLSPNAPPLVILGEGPERAALEQQIARLDAPARVWMPGFVPNPFSVVARADYMISASHNEGFPNAIAEAMALGKPVIATDCESGPGELLGGTASAAGQVTLARHGLLVPDHDVAALTRAMEQFEDPALRARYSLTAQTRMDDFAIDRIAALYWTLFDKVASTGRNAR